MVALNPLTRAERRSSFVDPSSLVLRVSSADRRLIAQLVRRCAGAHCAGAPVRRFSGSPVRRRRSFFAYMLPGASHPSSFCAFMRAERLVSLPVFPYSSDPPSHGRGPVWQPLFPYSSDPPSHWRGPVWHLSPFAVVRVPLEVETRGDEGRGLSGRHPALSCAVLRCSALPCSTPRHAVPCRAASPRSPT